jgi:hypothetical protein
MSTKQLVSEITAFSQPSTAAVSMPVSTAAPLTAAAATSAAVNISPTDATAVFEVSGHRLLLGGVQYRFISGVRWRAIVSIMWRLRQCAMQLYTYCAAVTYRTQRPQDCIPEWGPITYRCWRACSHISC